ncbi:MAG: rRNA (cytidine1402-2-O)-methyltransferase [Actinomycetota bacterium]|nr:rRNA (cytidine1402-2-O)-methyltransferase [Actinomycetota bacterium]
MIVLAATPLGNRADASDRLRALLAEADVVAAEDTRRLRRLAADLGVTVGGRVVSFYDAVEAGRVAGLLDAAAAGQLVLVVSDAGTPVVSDPGYRLVAAAVDRGVRVSVAPGPSAVTAALAVSGLASDRFCFEGVPPRKSGDRARRFAHLAAEPRTMVFFESPRRVGSTLAELAEAFGDDRPAVLCRELTKTYEEVLRGSLAELVVAVAGGVLGEVTLVVAGARAVDAGVLAAPELAARVTAAEGAGLSRKEAMAEVARSAGVPRRVVSDAVLATKG